MTEEKFVAKENILGYLPIRQLLKMFALPAIISMLVSSLYNIIDQVFIGHAVGYLGIAATTIAFPIVTIVMAGATLLGAGGAALAAIKLGEGNKEAAERILNSAALTAVVGGVLLALIGNVFLETLLTLFGATAATMQYSKQFGGVMITIVPITMLVLLFANMARTDGSPRLSMQALVGGVLINAIVAPVFIFWFGWGVLGAALATTCAQAFSLSIFLWYFRCRSNMRLRRDLFFKPDFKLLRRAMAIGASSCMIQLSSTALQIIMNNSLLYYGSQTSVGGDAAIGAMGIVMKVNMVVISICIGIGIGAQPIIGFNRGAENYDRVMQTYKLAAKIASCVTLCGWFCCMVFPEQILIIFGSDGDTFLGFAVDCMRCFLGGVFTAGFQITSTSYFQASGQPLKASTLSLLRQFLFLIPLILLLPLRWGLYGIIYAGTVADLLSCCVVFLFISREMRKLSRLAAEHKAVDR